MFDGRRWPRPFLIALLGASLIHAFLILGFRLDLPRSGQSGRGAISMTLVRPTPPVSAENRIVESALPPQPVSIDAPPPESELPAPPPPAPEAPAPSVPPLEKTPPTAQPAPAVKAGKVAKAAGRAGGKAAMSFVGPPRPEPGATFVGPPPPSPRALKEARRQLAVRPPETTVSRPVKNAPAPVAPSVQPSPGTGRPEPYPAATVISARPTEPDDAEEADEALDDAEDESTPHPNDQKASPPIVIPPVPSPAQPGTSVAERLVDSRVPAPTGTTSPLETRQTPVLGSPNAYLPQPRQPESLKTPRPVPETAPYKPVPGASPSPAKSARSAVESSTQPKSPAADRVASTQAKRTLGAEKPGRQSGKGATPGASAETGKPRKPEFSAGLLSQQIAEIGADMARQRRAEMLRTKIVYAKDMRTHRLAIAAYEQAWQEKIERIGNLNFPDEARRDKLSGGLVLAVGIKPDGGVYSIQLHQSSGHAVLDDAARHIVELAAPFAPLPGEILEAVDVLVITRTWRFDSNYRLETRSR